MPLIASRAGGSAGGFGGLRTFGAAVVPTSFESIETITTTASQANATFSSISQSYNHLQIRMMLPSLGDTLELTFNGNTSNDYSAQGLVGSGASNATAYLTGASQPNIGLAAGSGDVQTLILDIMNYTSGVNKITRVINGVDSNGSGNIGLRCGGWYVGDAITSMRFRSQSGSFVAGCKFNLYGIKGA